MERLYTKRPAVELSSRKYPTIVPPLFFWYFPGVSIFKNSYLPLGIVLISLCISNRSLLHRQFVKSMIFIKILLRIFLFSAYHHLILIMKLCLKISLLPSLTCFSWLCPPTHRALSILPEKCHVPWESSRWSFPFPSSPQNFSPSMAPSVASPLWAAGD